MTEPTTRPTNDQHLARLARMADEIRGQLAAYREALGGADRGFPQGALEGLRQISGTLLMVRSSLEDIEQERRNLRALAEIGQVVNSSLDLTTVLNEVMDTIIRLTGAERAFLMLKNEEGGLDTVVARNWERASLSPSEQEISRTIVQRVVSQGEAVVTTNAQADPRFDQQASIVAYNLRSILCIPLKVKGELTGVIYADNRIREGLFSEKERNLLSAFGNQAAVALENARLFARVTRTLDDVTELNNLMDNVFSSIGSGVITADVGDLITLCNRAIVEILKVPRENLLGSSLQSLLPQLSADLPARVEEVKQADRRHMGLETHTSLPSRGEVDLSLNITPLKDAGQITRGVAIVVDDLTEQRRLQAQRRLFERMVAPAVIQQLDPDSLLLGGDRAEITTVFADIRGFTSFSETKDPETLVAVLNRYLSVAAEAILREEGTIDKFLGDAVMAWFNAPVPQPDHTLRAVRAAIAIRDAVPRLHQELEPSLRLRYGVGIHSGEAVLGLVGTERAINYTAIGDSVNTARRLQENALPDQILISRAAADRVRDQVELRSMPSMRLEGKGKPVEVFEVVGLK
jgi:PAS domain S-box-containing protein